MSIVPIIVVFIISLVISFVVRVAQYYKIAIVVLIITALTAGIMFYNLYSVISGGLDRKKVDYAEGTKHYPVPETIGEKALGEELSDYAKSLDNLGGLYNELDDDAKAAVREKILEAAKYYLELETIEEKALGKERPDNATRLDNLGGLYNELDDDAKDVREKILEAAKHYPVPETILD